MMERNTIIPSIVPFLTPWLHRGELSTQHETQAQICFQVPALSFEHGWRRASFIFSFPFPFVGSSLSKCVTWISTAACIDISNDAIHYRIQVFNKSYSTRMSLCWSRAVSGVCAAVPISQGAHSLIIRRAPPSSPQLRPGFPSSLW